MRLDPGAVFAGYTIERELGVGGMGRVYLAWHPRLERRIALKVLNDDAAGDAGIRARFDREAALVARLEHPHIVPIYDRSGPDDEIPWLCMKFVQGGDAAGLMAAAGGQLRADVALGLLTDAARALDYAHRHGILHRDVKPANILIDRTDHDIDRAVLSDFGIARAFDDSLTVTHLVATFAYTAPERFSGNPTDHRADIYSLGCTFYEILTGRKPFPHNDPAPVIAAHLHTPPPRPTDLRPDLPRALNNVIATALAKDPRNRYPTCTALATAVRSVLNQAQHPTIIRNPTPSQSAPPGPGYEITPPPRSLPLPVSNTAPPQPLDHDETLPYPPSSSAATPIPAQRSESTPRPAGPGGATSDQFRSAAPPLRPTLGGDAAREQSPLPELLRTRLYDPEPNVRREAVTMLAGMLNSSNVAQAEAARQALTLVAEHDIPVVASTAKRELGLSVPDGVESAGSPSGRGDSSPAAHGRFVRISNWVAGLVMILGGVLVLLSEGQYFASQSQPVITDEVIYPYDIGVVLHQGYYYVWVLGLVAIVLGVAFLGSEVFGRGRRRDGWQAMLAGFALAGLWGAVAFGELPNWLARNGWEVVIENGYLLILGGQVMIAAAGVIAAVALRIQRRGATEELPARSRSGAFAAALGVAGSLVLLLAHLPIAANRREIPGYTWQFATAAVFALIPVLVLFLRPRGPFRGLNIGWAIGGLTSTVFLATQTIDFDPDADVATPSGFLVAPMLFAGTLLGLAAVTVIDLRRSARR